MLIALTGGVIVARRRFIDRDRKDLARNLDLAEIPLVVSVLVLLVLVDLELLGIAYPQGLLAIPVVGFNIAIVVLAIYAAIEWRK